MSNDYGQDTIIHLKSEDQIKEIYQKINEIKSYVNITICAIENEFDPPEISDISESMRVLQSHINETVV